MEMRLQDLISEERELLVSASTLAQTEQVLKRFDSLESNAQVSQRANINSHTSLTINKDGEYLMCACVCARAFVGSARR